MSDWSTGQSICYGQSACHGTASPPIARRVRDAREAVKILSSTLPESRLQIALLVARITRLETKIRDPFFSDGMTMSGSGDQTVADDGSDTYKGRTFSRMSERQSSLPSPYALLRGSKRRSFHSDQRNHWCDGDPIRSRSVWKHGQSCNIMPITTGQSHDKDRDAIPGMEVVRQIEYPPIPAANDARKHTQLTVKCSWITLTGIIICCPCRRSVTLFPRCNPLFKDSPRLPMPRSF